MPSRRLIAVSLAVSVPDGAPAVRDGKTGGLAEAEERERDGKFGFVWNTATASSASSASFWRSIVMVRAGGLPQN